MSRFFPTLLLCFGACADKGDGSGDPGVDGADGAETGDPAPLIDWQPIFTEDDVGAWLSAWGQDEGDVWVVGGQPEVGAIRRGPIDNLVLFDLPAGVPLLNWVHGTSPADVWVGGVQGTLLHWDGSAWTDHSLEVEEAIWGIYAVSADEVYAVGGESGFGGEQALALAWSGDGWTRLELPSELADLRNIFKVHHDGTALWMVGQGGAALRSEDGQTLQAVPTSTSADLVTANRPLSGGPLVVVGGRGTGVVLEVDSEAGSPRLAVKAQSQGGLNGVQVYPSGVAVVVGEAGVSGLYHLDSDRLDEVLPTTRDVLHATCGVPGGRMLAVGGNLFTSDDLFHGTILVAPAPE